MIYTDKKSKKSYKNQCKSVSKNIFIISYMDKVKENFSLKLYSGPPNSSKYYFIRSGS
jgi:hypothetical protein